MIVAMTVFKKLFCHKFFFNLSKTTEQEWNVQSSGVGIKIANNIDYEINYRPIIERWIEGLCWQNQGLAMESNSGFVGISPRHGSRG